LDNISELFASGKCNSATILCYNLFQTELEGTLKEVMDAILPKGLLFFTSLRKPAISRQFKDSWVTPTRPTRFSAPESPTKSWLAHWMIGYLLLDESFQSFWLRLRIAALLISSKLLSGQRFLCHLV
jgi:hypothetical protein